MRKYLNATGRARRAHPMHNTGRKNRTKLVVTKFNGACFLFVSQYEQRKTTIKLYICKLFLRIFD